MKSLFVVYKTDEWHSYSSRDIIGICTNTRTAIKICKEKAKKEFKNIDKEQLFNLQNIKQTQGYSGEGEFQFEEIEINVLL